MKVAWSLIAERRIRLILRIAPIAPDRLAGGTWWRQDETVSWPDALLGGIIEPRKGYRFRPENLALIELDYEANRQLGGWSTWAREVGSLLLIAVTVLCPPQAVAVGIAGQGGETPRRTLLAPRLEHIAVLEGDLRRAEELGEKSRCHWEDQPTWC